MQIQNTNTNERNVDSLLDTNPMSNSASIDKYRQNLRKIENLSKQVTHSKGFQLHLKRSWFSLMPGAPGTLP